MDDLLDLSHDAEIIKLNNNFFEEAKNASKNKQANYGSTEDGKYVLGKILSNYGGHDIGEFIAESWCEYLCSPNPRKMAKAVGDRILKVYEAKYGHEL